MSKTSKIVSNGKSLPKIVAAKSSKAESSIKNDAKLFGEVRVNKSKNIKSIVVTNNSLIYKAPSELHLQE